MFFIKVGLGERERLIIALQKLISKTGYTICCFVFWCAFPPFKEMAGNALKTNNAITKK
jgi:hypothetical protein